MSIMVITIFAIFFSVSILDFIKILKLKFSLRNSEFFKDSLKEAV
jgi:hypothetical protein